MEYRKLEMRPKFLRTQYWMVLLKQKYKAFSNTVTTTILHTSRKNNDEKEEENQNKSSMCTPEKDQGISSPQTRLTARGFSPENVRTVCVMCNHV